MQLINKNHAKSLLPLIAIAIMTLLLIATPVLAANPPRWTYGDAENPTQWGVLSDDFAACE
jgi:carbonic anhydrase